MSTNPDQPRPLSLDQLLRRDDIWRGNHSQENHGPSLDCGHSNLNALFLHNGWPLGALIEICQQRFQGEWQLFLPALSALDSGLVVLLNPPAEPFSQALIQAGVDLDRLVVVEASDKTEFLRCFRELARTNGCAAILGWQPREVFTYTELRKCTLAAAEGAGLYTLFRSAAVQQQSSPALLRLFCQIIPAGLEVTVFKQKGYLQRHQPKPVVVALPAAWQGALPHAELDKPVRTSRQPSGRSPVVKLRRTP